MSKSFSTRFYCNNEPRFTSQNLNYYVSQNLETLAEMRLVRCMLTGTLACGMLHRYKLYFFVARAGE
jgi:hypothetical protein